MLFLVESLKGESNEVEVTISGSNYNVDDDDSNFIISMASKSIEGPPISKFRLSKFAKDEKDDQDKFIDTYNMLFKDIKYEKSKRGLEEKENELTILRDILEEKKS